MVPLNFPAILCVSDKHKQSKICQIKQWLKSGVLETWVFEDLLVILCQNVPWTLQLLSFSGGVKQPGEKLREASSLKTKFTIIP